MIGLRSITRHAIALSLLCLTLPVMSIAQSLDDRLMVPRDGVAVITTMPMDSIHAPAPAGPHAGVSMHAGRGTMIEARDPYPWEIVHGEPDPGPLPEGVVRMRSTRSDPGSFDH